MTFQFYIHPFLPICRQPSYFSVSIRDPHSNSNYIVILNNAEIESSTELSRSQIQYGTSSVCTRHSKAQQAGCTSKNNSNIVIHSDNFRNGLISLTRTYQPSVAVLFKTQNELKRIFGYITSFQKHQLEINFLFKTVSFTSYPAL